MTAADMSYVLIVGQHADRTEDLLERSRLVKRGEAARLFGMSPKAWDSYWTHHEDLCRGVRTTPVPDTRPGRGNGQPHRKWPLRVLLRHIERQCRQPVAAETLLLSLAPWAPLHLERSCADA